VTETVNVFAISGSLRKGSYNSAALRACQGLAPEGMVITIYDRLAEVPPYDDDIYQQGAPPVVVDLRERIAVSDAILIASPEYNHSIPGVLKNAIDWASRPPNIPIERKSVALLGASIGMLGTVRAQLHMRDVFVFLNGTVLNKPEVFIGAARTKFAEDGTLIDRPTTDILRTMLVAFRDQTLALKRAALVN